MSNMTDLWLSGVFFQALNTPKLVFGRWGSLRRSPDPLVLPNPFTSTPRRLRRLDLGAFASPIIQIPGYADVAVVLTFFASDSVSLSLCLFRAEYNLETKLTFDEEVTLHVTGEFIIIPAVPL